MTLIVRSQTPGPMRHETVRKLTNPLEEMQARYSPVAAETPKWQQKSPIDGRGFQNTALDRSDVQFCDARLHICCRFVQRGLFIGGELDLDDFFHPVLPDLDRNAAIDVLQSVLALKPCCTRKNSFLIAYDGLDHFDCCSRRSIVGASGLQEIDDLGATITRPFHETIDRGFVHEVGERNAGDGRVSRQGNQDRKST